MINVQFTPAPGMTETILFTDFDKIKAIQEKKVIVEVHPISKTRLSVSLRSGSTTVGANFIPPGSEGLKFDEVISTNWATGNRSVKRYFKVSKKQNREVLVNHIKNLVQEVFAPLEDFNVIIWENAKLINVLPKG